MKTAEDIWNSFFKERHERSKYISITKKEFDLNIRTGHKIKFYNTEGTVIDTDGCDGYCHNIPCDKILIIRDDYRRERFYFCCLTKQIGMPQKCPLSKKDEIKINVKVIEDTKNGNLTFIIQDFIDHRFKVIKEYVI